MRYIFTYSCTYLPLMTYVYTLALLIIPCLLAGQSIQVKEKKGDTYLMEKKKVVAGPFTSVKRVYATSQYLIQTEKWGIYDKLGVEVVPPTYDSIHHVASHYYHVRQNGQHGIIDSSGRTVVPPQFEDIDYYTDEGEALVKSAGRWVMYRNGVLDSDEHDPVFRTPERMPKFSDCGDNIDRSKGMDCASKEMLEFIFENIHYPREAIAQRIEGMVVVKFIVEKDGTLTNFEVIREIGGGCGDAAVSVAKRMDPWVPGMQDGQLVRTRYNLPIKFQL